MGGFLVALFALMNIGWIVAGVVVVFVWNLLCILLSVIVRVVPCVLSMILATIFSILSFLVWIFGGRDRYS